MGRQLEDAPEYGENKEGVVFVQWSSDSPSARTISWALFVADICIQIILPDLPNFPLFRPVPIHIKIKCRSKSLPLESAQDPQTFVFPRNPTAAQVDLRLRSKLDVHKGLKADGTKGFTTISRSTQTDLGLQAGFGTPKDAAQRVTWGKMIEVHASTPRWENDPTDLKKGFWTEEVTFSSFWVLRCSLPIVTPMLTTSVSSLVVSINGYFFLITQPFFFSSKLTLLLVVDFPGLGNKVKLNIPDIEVTSGIPPPPSYTDQPPPVQQGNC